MPVEILKSVDLIDGQEHCAKCHGTGCAACDDLGVTLKPIAKMSAAEVEWELAQRGVDLDSVTTIAKQLALLAGIRTGRSASRSVKRFFLKSVKE